MRVALLSKALVVGAYQRKCALLAEHEDIALTVLVPPRWGHQALEERHACNYALRVLPIRFNGHFHLHYYPTLGRVLRALQPELLHVDEEPYNLATWLAVRQAARLKPRPALVCFSWQNLNRRYPAPFCWMERDVLRRIDALIAGSAESAQMWRTKGFRGPIHVVPQFGVDEVAFAPVPRPANDTFTIGYAGRLVHEKGVDVLLRAFAQLPSSARLLIVGEGKQRQALERLAASLGVSARVHFRPPLPSTAMPSFYHSLDAFVLPSRSLPNWKEQFGRVLIEAMACGVPVITSSCGEAPNVVGDAGLVFPEEDADALAAHLRTLMDDAEHQRALAARGRARVLAHFTMRHVAAQTAQVWRAAYANHTHRSAST
ncbi:MAG: glycosyltransferase [Anaerolineae bacterium]|nr:glycosyltransferase [Anaerolineae bacterium]